jgi:putative lipoprotein
VIVACVGGLAACSRTPERGAGSKTDAAAPATTPAPAPAVNDSTTPGSVELRGTDWRLVAVGERVAAPADSQRAAHLILQPNSKQVVGSGGCNRLFGVYELNGGALRFSGVGSTKMACRTGMDTEAAFLSTLLHVARWRINGQQLAMSDSSGAVLARFEATPK